MSAPIRAVRRPVGVVATGEHEHEPVHGLPGHLPAGERVLWQGSPDWRALAQHAFHLRALAGYFGVLLAWRAVLAAADGGGAAAALRSLAWPLPLALAGLGLVALLAWLSARTTVYTLTDRRIVMRVGIVLSISFNLPLSQIDGASLRRRGAWGVGAADTGDIALALSGGQRIAYLHLWPHARPWRLAHTEPMLRSLPDAPAVAARVAEALRATLTAAAAEALPAAPQPGALPVTAAPAATATRPVDHGRAWPAAA